MLGGAVPATAIGGRRGAGKSERSERSLSRFVGHTPNTTSRFIAKLASSPRARVWAGPSKPNP